MHRLDEWVLLSLARYRSSPLDRVMIDITALGAPTLILLISAFAFVVLWAIRNRRGAVQVAFASLGGEIWVEILKRVVHRPRQTIVPPLADFAGFSFPSGHVLASTAAYAMIGAIACTYARDRRTKAGLWSICAAIVALIGISRIYLGAHYPTDVAAGLLIGLVWFYTIRFVAVSGGH